MPRAAARDALAFLSGSDWFEVRVTLAQLRAERLYARYFRRRHPGALAPPRALTYIRQRMDNTTTPKQAASLIVASLELAWNAIRARHPDVPPAVIVLASGGAMRATGEIKLGHYAAARWHVAGGAVSEVLIAGEGLRRGGREVFATLLHEAAHGLAFTRELKDTSRGGRYHNLTFAQLANELRLDVERGTHGHNQTTLSDATAEDWRETIAHIDTTIEAYWRQLEPNGARAKERSRQLLAMCACGTKLRIARAAFEAAPITCGGCERDFELEEDAEDMD